MRGLRTSSLVLLASLAPGVAAAQDVRLRSGVRATLDRYCVTCHNSKTKTADLALDAIDLANVPRHADTLEKIVRKLRAGAMPPAGAPRPDAGTSSTLVSWLEAQLDRAAAAHVNAGRTEALHRLNRAEYQNAVRDLLDLEGLDVAAMLPPDDASYGFDNIAGVLGMSPTHLDRYLSAARKIARIAVGDVTIPPYGETLVLPSDLSQDDGFDGLSPGTRGGTLIRRYFPVDGEYLLKFQIVSGVGTESEANQVEVSVDGEPVFSTTVEQKVTKLLDDRANTDYELRIPVRGGLRQIAVTFIQATNASLEDYLQPYLRPPGVSIFKENRIGGYSGPYVSVVSITGPLNATGPGDTPTRRRIFTCRPGDPGRADLKGPPHGEDACARRILGTLARRAYRRPVTAADVDQLVEFYKQGRADRDFEHGIRLGLERMLASSNFLFRVERDAPNAAAGRAYRVSDLELASRLSFFLWSSIPDETLLDLAVRGELGNPNVLRAQVRRMLRDPRSDALINNFTGQWLRLRSLPVTTRDTRQFPDFGENLRSAFRRETELFFGSILREDRSALELLDGTFTFLNERLARHYGIRDVYGDEFRRVAVTDPNRRGLLGQGSILAVTSQPNRTSPVVRGKFILENLLGTPPPAPPPDVPPLEATKVEGTLRQKMEQHRKNPVCASCHRTMDPLGFALENFDAVGAWRKTDDGAPLDVQGTLPDGTTFDGVAGLRAALLRRPDVFVTTLTEKLMIYALGRGLEPYDASATRAIVRTAAQQEYRLSSIIAGIVNSVPFRMRQAGASGATGATGSTGASGARGANP